MTKVGLALAGGGVRGSYQAGAYKAMCECGIKVNAVSGTSIGSFNAAMIAQHKGAELIKFWQTIDLTKIFEIDKAITEKTNSIKKIEVLFKTVNEKLKNEGFDINPLRKELKELIDEKKIRKSRIKYGIVTVKQGERQAMELFQKDMAKGKIVDYILASCFLPIFKKEKLIDDNYYLDGGYMDVCPVRMLKEIGCKKIYGVRLNAIGVEKKIKDKDTKVIYITPHKKLGSIISLDSNVVKRNIDMGYYDTLKVLKNLDGINYYFKHKTNAYYEKITSKMSLSMIKKARNYFLAYDLRDVVIKALEYVLKVEKQEMYTIYNQSDIIKRIKKDFYGKEFVYEFINKLTV